MPERPQQNQNRAQGDMDEEFIEETDVGMPWKLMVLTFVLFLFSLLLYGGLRFGYKPYLNDQIESVESDMQNLSESISEGEKEKFLDFYSQLKHLQGILDSRKFSRNVFTFLENNTIAGVSLTNFNFSADSSSVKVAGQGQSLKSVVDQVAVYEKSPGVSGVVLGDLSLDADSQEVGFEAQVLFKSSYLRSIQ